MCEASPECISFDFDASNADWTSTAQKSCWLSSTCTEEISDNDRTDITLLIKVKAKAEAEAKAKAEAEAEAKAKAAAELKAAYEANPGRYCKGRNEVASTSGTLAECAAKCEASPECISFDFGASTADWTSPAKKGCWLSSTCTEEISDTDRTDITLLIKISAKAAAG